MDKESREHGPKVVAKVRKQFPKVLLLNKLAGDKEADTDWRKPVNKILMWLLKYLSNQVQR
jgi:hypothetical protein